VIANLNLRDHADRGGSLDRQARIDKATFLIPYVLLFALLGCYLFGGLWQNLLLVMVVGSLGYLFKRHDWPRAPFIIGVILGKIAEDSLQKAIAISVRVSSCVRFR
jgi:TctA family transporter